jgi:hypothetical protein
MQALSQRRSPNENIQYPSAAGGTFDCARGWWREEETANESAANIPSKFINARLRSVQQSI